MTDPQSLHIITGWLNGLAKLTRQKRANPTPEELADHKDTIALFATMLAKDLPTGAFTADSLRYAVIGQRFFPAYEHIRKEVGDWWKANRPATAPQLTQDGVEKLSLIDRKWLDYYHRECGKAFDATQSRTAYEARVHHLNSLLKTHALAAYRIVSGDQGEVYTPPTAEQMGQVRDAIRNRFSVPEPGSTTPCDRNARWI